MKERGVFAAPSSELSGRLVQYFVAPTPLDYACPSPRDPQSTWFPPSLPHALVLLFFIVCGLVLAAQSTGRVRTRSFDSMARQRVATVAGGLDVFAADNGRYPTAGEGLDALLVQPLSLPGWRCYMDSVPTDPWGNRPHYRPTGPADSPTGYELTCLGPDRQLGTADDIVHAGGAQRSRPSR